MSRPVRLTVILLSAVLLVGYLLAAFLTRDIWAGRDGTRVTLAAQTRDGSAPSPEAMAQAERVVAASLTERGVSDAEVAADGRNLVATYSGHDLDSDALRDMFGPGGSKTLYLRPVIHAIRAQPETPPPTPAPTPSPGGDPAQAIADERQLRQSTDQQIQLLALQFQATRCNDDDKLAGHDDPTLPLITCSTDGELVYLLDKSIIGGDQIESATSGRDSQRGQYVVDLEFDDGAARTWADYTAGQIGTQTAFTIDTKVISAPEIQEQIPGGHTQITGQFDADNARALADALNRGALPLTLSIESSTDEMLPPTAFSNLMRIIVAATGVGIAVIVLGAVVLVRRRS